jgi:Cu(I)/Ag(I) efflux system membrane protein CusA/SilA
VEVGVVMLVYLRQALTKTLESGQLTADRLRQAVTDGALMRLRPVLMTVTATLVGLLPIMVGTGTGAEVTRRIAAPMVGGVLSLLPLALLVVPSLYLLAQRRNLSVAGSEDIPEEAQNRVV